MNTSLKDRHQSINILAFDTSGDEASLSVWARGTMRSLSLPFGTGSHSQAAQLLPSMKDLLNQASIDFQQLDVVATPRGPGSFTGIRLGLATAQGLLLSTKATSFAPTTFEILAFGAWREQLASYLVTIATKRDTFYVQGFDEMLNPLFPAIIKTEEEVQELLATKRDMQRIISLPTLSSHNLIHLYLHKLTTSQDPTLCITKELPALLAPYYLHNPEFVMQKLCSL
ncbi:MAG: tRNA (adenosine(37)-N6)-threonylcarbamoyltransferase complex dimerization subunit type 1 TsaB [Alphaproteobacteria bacterium]|jgi:tRNA threonylcarbamoyl adenosine modification protein YeaZ|nr:tRNA (adenosine(37)-N6)-threonylcarbamoyltransferase complex dimerization subunit type 1 TsaB [Alphaproteobacteria bacterium]